ncbi:GNAT family N-acetyltransferase [bacterium]|nr:GNAT family N-acetyltransferase [bacterium]
MDAAIFQTLFEVRRQDPIPTRELQPLIEASLAEGHHFLQRLAREAEEGSNTFQGAGEAFFFAYQDGRLVGTAGLNLDPFEKDPNVGRVRRVYVLPGYRGQGIARRLLQTVLKHNRFPILHLRSTPEACRLYESLGFTPTGRDNPTHRKVCQASI